MTRAPLSPPGLLSPQYLWTTVGTFALVFLGAFESLAVTTVMPAISRDLDGRALYALAFSGTLAASVIGMVVGGRWSDRRGPTRPVIASIVIFVVGLVISGTATGMETFIVGRLLQGFGLGANNVALYVVVARIYPAALHPRIFASFATAWVLPSLIGPPVAGVIADSVGWHWVFLGVGGLVLLAAVAIAPAIRHLRTAPAPDTSGEHRAPRWSVIWSVLVAVGVLVISVAGDRAGNLAWPISAAALVVVVLALRPLLPVGTLVVRRGLPATVLFRGAVAATFFGTEVYLPYLLHDAYGLPSWQSGLILTVGVLSWAAGSQVQGWLGGRMSHATAVRIGACILVAGVAVQLLSTALMLSPLVAAAGWLLSGGGMGLVFPRISTLVLAGSEPREQGFNSAAVTIADATGGATAIAFAGLLFAAFGAAAGGGFVAAFAFTTALALVAVPIAFRVSAPRQG